MNRRNESVALSSAVFESTRKNLDTSMKRFYLTVSDFFALPEMKKLMLSRTPTSEQEALLTVKNALGKITVQFPILSDAALFFNREKNVLSLRGIETLESFRAYDERAVAGLDRLNGLSHLWVPQHPVERNGKHAEVLTFIMPVLDANGEQAGAFIALFSVDRLMKEISIGGGLNEYFFAADSASRVVFGNRDAAFLSSLFPSSELTRFREEREGSAVRSFEGRMRRLLYGTSESNEWVYVALFPVDTVLPGAASLSFPLFVSVPALLALMLYVVILFFALRRHEAVSGGTAAAAGESAAVFRDAADGAEELLEMFHRAQEPESGREAAAAVEGLEENSRDGGVSGTAELSDADRESLLQVYAKLSAALEHGDGRAAGTELRTYLEVLSQVFPSAQWRVWLQNLLFGIETRIAADRLEIPRSAAAEVRTLLAQPDPDAEKVAFRLDALIRLVSEETEFGRTLNADEAMSGALDFINSEYRRDLSLDECARKAGYSPQYFSMLFKRYSGQTLVSYITELRVSDAAALLRETDESVSEIARQTGFSNVQYFIRVFKKAKGLSPLAFRKRAAAGPPLRQQ